MSNYFTTAIILLGGEGKRFNHPMPKQFHHLSGKKIYLYTLESFLRNNYIDAVVLVVPQDFHSLVKNDLASYSAKPVMITEGKNSRQLSSYAGLKACPALTTHVVIHDGVRPFVSEKMIEQNVILARNYDACDTCIPSHDTIVHSKDHKTISAIPPRSLYLRGQTPQSFKMSTILQAHQKAQEAGIFDATDDCQLLHRLGKTVYITEGSDENIKITTEYDLLLAEQILRLRSTQKSLHGNICLKNKVFVVTGALGGIGSAIVNALRTQGAICIELSKSPLSPIDLSNPSQTASAYKKIFEQHKFVDGLINATGYLVLSNLENLDDKNIEDLVKNNFLSMVYSCKYCRIKPGGHILNFSSSSYTRGRAQYIIYSAMKAAIVNFTQGLALERPELNVNCIVPARTNTPLRTKNFPGEDVSLLLDSSNIAEKVIQILRCENLTGMTVEIKKK